MRARHTTMASRGVTLVAGSLLVLGVAGCGDDPSTAEADDRPAGRAVTMADLDGRVFSADMLTSPDHTLVEGTAVRLAFSGRDVAAHAGCNHLSGTARIEDGALTVSALAATEMGCPQPLADQDTWLQGLLASAPTLALDGSTLTLTSGDTTLELTESEAPGPGGDPDDATHDGTDDGGVTGTVLE